MNSLEQQLAALLTEAPGEPPNLIDPDAVLARAPRRRWVAPALAAAAVVAIAVPIAVVALRDSGTSSTKPPTAGTEAPLPPTTVTDPKADAIARISAALDAAPLPPGAVQSDTELDPVKQPISISSAPNQVHRTAWYTVPGDTDPVIAYLKAHPPTGLTLQGWAGGGSTDEQELNFADEPTDPATYALELDYDAAPYNGGVALRVDAWTIWAPNRPDWSFVPADATSVDLTIVRGGSPAVQRTLTGDTLAQLADAINALPPQAPEGPHGCVEITAQASDIAVFHTPAGNIRMVDGLVQCSFNAVITAAQDDEKVYVRAGDFNSAVLAALGLPKNYGFGH